MTTAPLERAGRRLLAQHPRAGGRGPGTADASCRTCSWASWSIYFLIPFWWLVVASTKNAAGPVRRHNGALWFDRRLRTTSANLSELFTYNGRHLPALARRTRCSTPSPAASARPCWPCWPATASRSSGSRGRRVMLRHAARLGDGAADRAGHPDLHPVLQRRPHQHDLGGDPAVAAEPVRGLPDAGLRRATRCPTSCWTPPGWTAPGSSGRSSGWRCRCCGPAIVTVLLLSVVGTWNNYFLPLAMLSDTKLLPGHRRPRAVAGPGLGNNGARRRACGASSSRLAGLGHPADHRVPHAAAVLAGRAGHRQPQVDRCSAPDRPPSTARSEGQP